MNPEHKIAALGGVGLLAKITVEQFNHYAGAVIAGITILALIPLAFSRWAEFLSNKKASDKMKRAGKIAVVLMFALGVLAWVLFVTGCTALPWNSKPKFSAPGVELAGPVQTPAVVWNERDTFKIPTVRGTTVTISTAGDSGNASTVGGPAAAPAVELTSERSGVVTPTHYAPPAPATPAELADGNLKIWLTLGAVVGVAAGLFGVVRGWDFIAIGGACVAAASGVGLIASKIPSWVYIVGAVGATIAGAGWAAWHFKIKPLSIKIENGHILKT